MSGLTGTSYRTNLVYMENNIQKARDVLAKWCKSHAWFPAPWAIRNEQPGRANWSDVIFDQRGDSLFTYDEEGGDEGGDEFSPTHDAGTDPTIAMLIVGATDPELLDAIDGLLETASHWSPSGGEAPVWVMRIAAAILAADERMSA